MQESGRGKRLADKKLSRNASREHFAPARQGEIELD